MMTLWVTNYSLFCKCAICYHFEFNSPDLDCMTHPVRNEHFCVRGWSSLYNLNQARWVIPHHDLPHKLTAHPQEITEHPEMCVSFHRSPSVRVSVCFERESVCEVVCFCLWDCVCLRAKLLLVNCRVVVRTCVCVWVCVYSCSLGSAVCERVCVLLITVFKVHVITGLCRASPTKLLTGKPGHAHARTHEQTHTHAHTNKQQGHAHKSRQTHNYAHFHYHYQNYTQALIAFSHSHTRSFFMLTLKDHHTNRKTKTHTNSLFYLPQSMSVGSRSSKQTTQVVEEGSGAVAFVTESHLYWDW